MRQVNHSPAGIGPFVYGKAGVRFLDVERLGATERVREVNARVLLTGGINEAYMKGDNARMVTTDALAELVQEHCGDLAGAPPEVMAMRAVAALAERYPHLPDVAVSLEVRPLDPIAGTYAHIRTDVEVTGATARQRGSAMRCRARLRGLLLVRTSGSRFEGFVVDRYTRTEPAVDRAIGAAVKAGWEASRPDPDWRAVRTRTRSALVRTFATEENASVQQLAFLMAKGALEDVPETETIKLEMETFRLSRPVLSGGSGSDVPATTPRTLAMAGAPRGQVRVRLDRSAITIATSSGSWGGDGQ